jgi:hypothetical protein
MASFKIHGKEERLGAAKKTLRLLNGVPNIEIIDINDSCWIIGKRFFHELPYELLSAIQKDDRLALDQSPYQLEDDKEQSNLKHLRRKP